MKNTRKANDKKLSEKHSLKQEIVLKKENRINTDPNGSWTGVPDDPYEKPVQDVDDL